MYARISAKDNCTRGGNQPKGETYVVGSNTGGAEPSKPFKTEAQVPDTEPQKSVLALQHPSIS